MLILVQKWPIFPIFDISLKLQNRRINLLFTACNQVQYQKNLTSKFRKKFSYVDLGPRVQQITYTSTYVRLVKQVVHTFFFQRTLTYVRDSSIAYTRSMMTKYL